jgi:hypothetical protein
MSHVRITEQDRKEHGELLDRYVGSVVRDWEMFWKDRPDHRYGQDFHAFLGERVLTDWRIRHHDRTP